MGEKVLMLKNENIICISSIDWDFIWQGHQEIMSSFAKNGNRVLFIENTGVRSPGIRDVSRLRKRLQNWLKSTKGFRVERENIFVFSPMVLPFPYSKLARWINGRLLLEPLRRWAKAMSFRTPIIWTFLPTSTANDIIDEFYYRKLLVYYNIADFNALTDHPKMLKASEEELMKKCDVIFAQGSEIADKCMKFNPNVAIFPFGVNTEVFDEYLASKSHPEPSDLKGIPRPIVGYVGGIHKHVDTDILAHLARSHPEWSIVLVGPKQIDAAILESLPNVRMLGKRDFRDLPAYIDRFDVCTVPYVVSEYTNTVYPTKLNEYYIMGKPVVSTALPEVVSINAKSGDLTYIASDRDDFVKKIERSLAEDCDRLRVARRDLARSNSWQDRIARMNLLMEEAIERRKDIGPANWQERFLQLYKKTRHGALKLALAALALYLLVFYTPVIWMAAGPLKIYDKPGKADAIVVLGGGIGESGKAGQGHEERVLYSVELYKNGLAGHILYSSGYVHVFNETQVMKALAISLGVPSEAIMVEDRVSNTYDSVLSAAATARANGWSRIMLLSSPYNMLRASRVFKKHGRDIKVLYVPIPSSSFYSHNVSGIFTRKISAEQIAGIAHEYIGLLYYYWKGWI